MVEKYKMSNNKEDLLMSVKNELRSELSKHTKEILQLKDIMLNNEIITFDDIKEYV